MRYTRNTATEGLRLLGQLQRETFVDFTLGGCNHRLERIGMNLYRHSIDGETHKELRYRDVREAISRLFPKTSS